MLWVLGFKRHNIIWILELDMQVKATFLAIVTANLKELRYKTILNNMVYLEFGNFVNSDSVLQLNSHSIYKLQRSCSICDAYSICLGTVSKPKCSVSRCAAECELRLRCSCGSCHSFTHFAVYLATSAVFGLLL